MEDEAATMIMARKDTCGRCGKNGAELSCPCHRIQYCNKACQKAAWEEHKLVCSRPKKSSSKSSSSEFAVGDIVLISGLQSEAGRKMNDRLAEVYEPINKETGRVGVILTVDSYTVKTAALKNDNLSVQLSFRDAAIEGARYEKEMSKQFKARAKTGMQEKYIKKCKKLGRTKIPSMPKSEIVQRIREADEHVLQAIILPGGPDFTATEREELFNNGLADACLGFYQFPDIIDRREVPPWAPFYPINMLSNQLSGDHRNTTPGEKARMDEHRVDVCRKLGPAILIWATKKRRLYASTEHWWAMHAAVMSLVTNCLMADQRASKVLLNELGPVIKTLLLKQVIFALTVNPSLFLRAKSPVLKHSQENMADALMDLVRVSAAQSLVDLADIYSVGEPVVRSIGMTVVPAGAPGLTGRKFAECFLDCAARHALSDGDFPSIHEKPSVQYESFHYVYSCLMKSPSLMPLLGEFDQEFTMIDSPQKFICWARARLGSS